MLLSIARHRSVVDRRTVLVTLTEAGRALEGPVNDAWRTLEDTVEVLTPEEQDTLLVLLGRVVESLAAKRRS